MYCSITITLFPGVADRYTRRINTAPYQIDYDELRSIVLIHYITSYTKDMTGLHAAVCITYGTILYTIRVLESFYAPSYHHDVVKPEC